MQSRAGNYAYYYTNCQVDRIDIKVKHKRQLPKPAFHGFEAMNSNCLCACLQTMLCLTAACWLVSQLKACCFFFNLYDFKTPLAFEENCAGHGGLYRKPKEMSKVASGWTDGCRIQDQLLQLGTLRAHVQAVDLVLCSP